MPLHLHQRRPQTEEDHARAIERAAQHIRANLVEQLDLHHLASIAFMSKFHFLRVFEEITGTTPHNFVACCRIARAKELLIKSTHSITDICMEVGYSSVGSFSTTFSMLVGASPSQFRASSQQLRASHVAEAINQFLRRDSTAGPEQLRGIVEAPPNAEGFIFIGAFDRGAPQGAPDAPAILLEPGPFCIARPRDSASHLLAAMIPFSVDLGQFALACPVSLVASQRLSAADPATTPRVLKLRPPKLTDPPVVVTLPLLLADIVSEPPRPGALLGHARPTRTRTE
jgi:AraC-like DNA-binding protein